MSEQKLPSQKHIQQLPADGGNEYNRLIFSQSPYLLQHAKNPVDWYEWSDEAFEKAKTEDKPIFLSIGYSTCHWCHVMAHESFEDSSVAELMNDTFVNIKVDREERPDIDNVYMDVCQALTGHGGWPLTIIMTPEKKPFFAATFIPKESRNGRMGMRDLSRQVKTSWHTEREKLLKSAEEITHYFADKTDRLQGADITASVLDLAVELFLQNADETHGGFGNSPKFPTPHNLIFLLRAYHQTKDETVLNTVTKTLDAMRLGGIWDHVGFGFHRYSTDREWLLPHFEKMLYDQALLMMAYTEAYQITKNPLYKQTVEEIITYLKRDMRSQNGGFYSAEDADSEGEEGKFYVWGSEEIQSVLGKEEGQWFARQFNFHPEGNFKEEHTGERLGTNIPHLKSFPKDSQKISKALKQLFEIREKRIHPHKDDKILTDWNGLLIAALAKAANVFENEGFLNLAESAQNFIETELTDKNGALKKRSRNGISGLDAHLNDYSAVIWGLLELHESTQNEKYLSKAEHLTKRALAEFWDTNEGGFFFTSKHSETLFIRSKEIYDGAIPSGNSMMALNLIRLARLTGNQSYETHVAEIGKTFSKLISEHPSSTSVYLLAANYLFRSAQEIVVVPNGNQEDLATVLHEIKKVYLPNKTLLVKSENLKIPFVEPMLAQNGKVTVYICENFACQQPISDLDRLRNALAKF